MIKIIGFVVGIAFPFWYCSYQKKTTTTSNEISFSKQDTIAVIETALADSTLNTIFYESFPGKNLKIVSNKFVKPDYKIAFKGKYVPIVSYDSTLNNPTFHPIPARFFGEVFYFKTQPDQQINVYLLFRGTGLTADFNVAKPNVKWQITSEFLEKYNSL